jgi:hypothetical protein
MSNMSWRTCVTEGQLVFQFPVSWKATQFDTWSFYRNQFQNVCNGAKAVDIIAISPDTCVWFIEIKDYREHRRAKDISLEDETADKVRDTLAALLPAGVNANESCEQQMAREVLTANRLRVVLHLEQPAKHSKLFPRAIDPANIKQQLKRLLKAVDPHPQVVEISCMGQCPWTVDSTVSNQPGLRSTADPAQVWH